MMRLLRKHRSWLMMVIAILSIPFVFYFVKTDVAALRPEQDFARVYDRTVPMAEARKHARGLDMARELGLIDLAQNLTIGAKDQNDAYSQFVLNLLVLRHEADRLGVRPSPSEIIDVIHNLPTFQGASGFDLKKYDEFVQSALSPYGLGEAAIEALVRDDLTVKRIKGLVAIGLPPLESKVKSDFDLAYSKFQVSVIRLKAADLAKDVKISDEDIQKYFEAHKAEYKTEEKRKIDFVQLTLSDEQKKLTGKERIDALQKLADQANDVSQALLEKDADFKVTAKKFQLPIHTTGEFTTTAPDPQLKDARQVAAPAFKLTEKEPISDPVQTPNGFYILHLTGTVESRPLTAEEAKPKIVEALKKSRSQELLTTKGAEIAHQLRDTMKIGASLEAAARKAGVKVEKVPPFSLMDEPKVAVNAGTETVEFKEAIEPKAADAKASAAENEQAATGPKVAEAKETEAPKAAKNAKRKKAKKAKELNVAEVNEKAKPEDEKPTEAKPKEPNLAEKPPDLIAIQNAVARLEPGEVSEFVPWEDGGLIAFVEKRDPPDSATYAQQKPAFEERYLNNEREIVFFEWLKDRHRDAGLVSAAPQPAASPPPGPG